MLTRFSCNGYVFYILHSYSMLHSSMSVIEHITLFLLDVHINMLKSHSLEEADGIKSPTTWYWYLKCPLAVVNINRTNHFLTSCLSPSSWSAVTSRWPRQEKSREARLRSPLSSHWTLKATKCCTRLTTVSSSTFRWVRDRKQQLDSNIRRIVTVFFHFY